MLLARMNAELAMGDAVLKKAGTANVFTVFGEPDVQIDRTGDDVVIRLRGVDVYDPHHRRHPQQRHRQNRPLDDRHRLRRGIILRPALLLRRRRQRPLSATQARTQGRHRRGGVGDDIRHAVTPIPDPKTGKIAVKLINHYGDEVLKVFDVASD